LARWMAADYRQTRRGARGKVVSDAWSIQWRKGVPKVRGVDPSSAGYGPRFNRHEARARSTGARRRLPPVPRPWQGFGTRPLARIPSLQRSGPWTWPGLHRRA
jgi:hypothetical protein